MPKFIVGNVVLVKLIRDAETTVHWSHINTYLQDGLISDASFEMSNPFYDHTLMETLLYRGWKIGSAPLVIRFAKFIDWDDMLTYLYISDDMIRMFPEMVNWNLIFDNTYRSEDLHYEFEDKLRLDRVCWVHKSEDFLRRFSKHVVWARVEWHGRSEQFIRDFAEHVHWIEVEWEDRTPDFLDSYAEFINWEEVWFDMMPEWFIYKYADRINEIQWDTIGDTERSIDFLEKFKDKFTDEQLLQQPECPLDIYDMHPTKVKWHEISAFRLLPMWFIIKHADRLNWGLLSAYQKLTLPIVQRFESKINFGMLAFSNTLTYQMIRKYRANMYAVGNVKRVIEEEHAKMDLARSIGRDCVDLVWEYLKA